MTLSLPANIVLPTGLTGGYLRRLARLLVTAGSIVCFSNPAVTEVIWYWDDEFSSTQQTALKAWLTTTHDALEDYAGTLPFDVHVHLKRVRRGSGPVPWANTWRADQQELYFHVNPELAAQAFLADWTAPHEFSHLLLPYLGRGNAWFAEGFASYLQHSIMAEMGVIEWGEARTRRENKMRSALAKLEGTTEPLPTALPSLRRKRAYSTFYWGGAIYFERVDQRLKARESSLRSVLNDYVACCRLTPVASLDELVAIMDKTSGSRVFSSELDTMRTTPGCPALID